MSTRSRIGIERKDGTIRSVYHHWDGYPECMLPRLRRYTNSKTINTLMNGGDISSLESKQDWNRNTLDTPITLYYRDRGEDCPAEVSKDVISFKQLAANCGAEFAYLFKNGEWEYFSI